MVAIRRKMTLRWLDQKAPNGVFWIDEVQLSADGRQYQGKDGLASQSLAFRLPRCREPSISLSTSGRT